MTKHFVTDASLPVPQPQGKQVVDAIKSGELDDVPLALAHMKAQRDELLKVTIACREACLFDEDDGRIGVTCDAVIPSELFDQICAAIAAAEEG